MTYNWIDVRQLPSPGIPLKLKLSTGEIIDGVRPSYIESRENDDLGYRNCEDDIVLNVVKWAIR